MSLARNSLGTDEFPAQMASHAETYDACEFKMKKKYILEVMVLHKTRVSAKQFFTICDSQKQIPTLNIFQVIHIVTQWK